MGARAIVKGLRYIQRKDPRTGYVLRVFFVGGGPLPKGWRNVK